jgi:hypothetical protein
VTLEQRTTLWKRIGAGGSPSLHPCAWLGPSALPSPREIHGLADPLGCVDSVRRRPSEIEPHIKRAGPDYERYARCLVPANRKE